MSDAHLIHLTYRRDIDGLRAIAVLAVVVFHAFPEYLPGGFAGVDIFFVISGYLITSILLASLTKGRFNIREFYLRRIRRLFPALITVLVTTLAVGWFVLLGNEFSQLGKHVAGGAGFVANFVFWGESGYFDTSGETKLLLHLWSLGVEEQFYIAWPLLLWVCWRRQWSFVKLGAALALMSFAWNLYLVATDPVAAFYSPLSRLWELALGGLLAHIHLNRTKSSPFANVQSVAGLLILIPGFALLDAHRPFPGWWALLPVTGTLLILSAGSRAIVNQKVLSAKVMVWFGLISYPLYLWHWPLLSFARIIAGGEPASAQKALLVVLAIVLAWLTCKYIEGRIRFGPPARAATPWLLALMVGLVAAGLSIHGSKIHPRNSAPELTLLLAAGEDWEFPGKLRPLNGAVEGAYSSEQGTDDITLFLGDSHLQQYAPKITAIVGGNRDRANTALVVTAGGCPPIPGVYKDHPSHNRCAEARNFGLGQIGNRAVTAVVIGACWNCYFIKEAKSSGGESAFYTLVEGEKLYLRDPGGVAVALKQLEAFLLEINKSKAVYLLLDNPMGHAYAPGALYSGNRLQGLTANKGAAALVPQSPEEKALHRELIAVAERAGASVLDPRDALCQPDGCRRLAEDGRPLYKDDSHLRPFAVMKYGGLLEQTLLPHQTGSPHQKSGP